MKKGDLFFGNGTAVYPSTNPDTLTGFTVKTATMIVGSGTVNYLEATQDAPSVRIQNAGGHYMQGIAVRLG